MPDWQERITRETAPAIRVEHELRYAAAAPLIRGAAAWCDLGCGTGLAAAAGLGAPYDGALLLVDRDEASVAQAQEAIAARETTTLAADLADPAGLQRVRERLQALPGEQRCVTCFETLEHLAAFAPLVGLLVELAEEHGVTVALSVPNDAFSGVENPFHATSWGEGAVAELRSLLPDDHRLVHQVALQGSALVRPGASADEVTSVVLGDGVPTHFLLAFGPGADALGTGPRVVQADLGAERTWERQRESDLAYAEARVARLEARVRELEAPPTAPGGDAA